jgi:cell volume regulation protein A
VNEFTTSAVLLVVCGLLLVTSVVSTRGALRTGVPVALLFLGLGMLAGEDGVLGIEFADYGLAFKVGTLALVLILLDGGLNTSFASVRASLAPSIVLATVGVVATAAVVALGGVALGLPLVQAVLLGAIVSSTDAATVFAVLRGSRVQLEKRVARTLELESGLNDPMAVILVVAASEWALGGAADPWALAWQVPAQLVLGAAFGVAFGLGGRWLLQRLRASAGGLYVVATMGIALLAFGVATLAGGSGFLAVYVAAMFIGNGRIPYRASLLRIHDALAWLSQVTMFLVLGLLATPHRILDSLGTSVAIALGLAIVARPLAVALCLVPFRYPWRETVYISWVGLRGAVPVVLATFPVLAGVPDAEQVFDIVMVVVAVNALIPGATIKRVTRLLGQQSDARPPPAAVLEIASTRMLDGEIVSYHIDSNVIVCDSPVSQIPFPDGASILLIVRGEKLHAARGSTVLQDGDHVYVFARDRDLAALSLLFGQPETGA